MKTSGRHWTPTLTLAKLFEEQSQFFDALAAYELISQSDSSPAVRERIEDLHIRILNDPSNRYDPRIEKLFTPEELAYLKILNHNGFENMASAALKLGEGSPDEDIFIGDDDIFTPAGTAEEETVTELLREIEQQAQLNAITGLDSTTEITLKDLMVALLARFDKDQPISEIKLSDIMSIIMQMRDNHLKD
jgi:hypothetical protein